MKTEKQYLKIENELDKIVRAELNQRVSSRQKKKDIEKISQVIELKNRRIVETHQKGKTSEVLPSLLSGYLQTKEGGDLYLSGENLNDQLFNLYLNKKGRLETLFAASLMALPDKDIVGIVNKKKQLFDDNYIKIKELTALISTVENIRKEADMTSAIKPEDEETAFSYLREIYPLKADLKTIEARYIEVKDLDYIQEAVQKLHSAIYSAAKSLEEKSKKAAKFLFDQASHVFHNYKSTPVNLQNLEIFTAHKQELLRYLNNFDSIGDEERKIKIQDFISSIDATVTKLQKEIEKQKEHEARVSDKVQKEINDAYNRFLEIKELYAQGQLANQSQQKNAEEKLIKYRDTLIANGQRIMARDIERFLNSTGIRKKNKPKNFASQDNIDDFDYKKGFLILLPITIILFLFLLLMIVI